MLQLQHTNQFTSLTYFGSTVAYIEPNRTTIIIIIAIIIIIIIIIIITFVHFMSLVF